MRRKAVSSLQNAALDQVWNDLVAYDWRYARVLQIPLPDPVERAYLCRRLRFADSFVPGAYEITFAGTSQPVSQPPGAVGQHRTGFVVNLDATSESDLTKITRKELAWFGVQSTRIQEAGRANLDVLEYGIERGLWAPLLAGLLFLLVGECLLARKP